MLGSVLLNPIAVEWTAEQARDRRRRHRLARLSEGPAALLRPESRPTIAGTGRAILALIETARGVSAAAERSQLGPVIDTFDAFMEADTSILFLFAEGEPLYDQFRMLGVLDSLGKWPNVRVEQLPTRDHQLRPLSTQEFVHVRIDQFLTELLDAGTSDNPQQSERRLSGAPGVSVGKVSS